jgi:hypothetical protein
MLNEKLKRVVLILIVLPVITVNISGQVDKNFSIPALIKECGDNQRAMNRRVFEYSWTSREVSHGLNRKGEPTKEITKVFENFPRNKRGAKIALSKNGKLNSDKDVEKQRLRVAKELEKDEQERSQQKQETANLEFGISIKQTDTKQVFFKVFNFLRADEFYNPRRENYNGRETWVLDFKPLKNLPEMPPAISSIKVLVGRVWIDAVDKIVVRLEAWEPDASGANKIVEPQVVMEYGLLPENIWLLKSVRINTLKNPSLFNNVVIDWRFEKTNFQHFETEIKDYKTETSN